MWEDNIKINCMEMGSDYMEWFDYNSRLCLTVHFGVSDITLFGCY
jgi:hypothetical protein